MGQGICKCVEDESGTSASLDVTSDLWLHHQKRQNILIDPYSHSAPDRQPYFVSSCKLECASFSVEAIQLSEVPVLQDQGKGTQAGAGRWHSVKIRNSVVHCDDKMMQTVFEANFMGGILEGPWLRKGDNVFLGTIKDQRCEMRETRIC